MNTTVYCSHFVPWVRPNGQRMLWLARTVVLCLLSPSFSIYWQFFLQFSSTLLLVEQLYLMTVLFVFFFYLNHLEITVTSCSESNRPAESASCVYWGCCLTRFVIKAS